MIGKLSLISKSDTRKSRQLNLVARLEINGLILITFMIFTSSLVAQVEPDRFQKRLDFCNHLETSQSGDSLEVILSLVGPPSVKLVPGSESFERWAIPKANLIVCFGSTDSCEFPTIGHLYFDKNERLIGNWKKLCNVDSDKLAENFKDEAELASLLRVVCEVDSITSGRYADPAKLVRISNQLRPLGKKKILVLLEEYLRVVPHTDNRSSGIALLCRLLFTIPRNKDFDRFTTRNDIDKELPPNSQFPDWPLIVVEGIPFYDLDEFCFTGESYNAIHTVRNCWRFGQLKKETLVPCDHPARALYEFVDAKPELFAGEKGVLRKRLFANQVLNMTRHLVESDVDRFGFRISSKEVVGSSWNSCLHRVIHAEIFWCPHKLKYDFLAIDGDERNSTLKRR